MRFYTTAMCPQRRAVEKRFRNIRAFRRLGAGRTVTSVCLAVLLLATSVFATGALSAELENTWVKVLVNGQEVSLWNQPFIDNQELYLPLREVLNKYGIPDGNITYADGAVTVALPSAATGRTVRATMDIGQQGVQFDADADNSTVNYYWGGKRSTTHPVLLVGGVTYAPLGAFIRMADYSLDEVVGTLSAAEEKMRYVDDFRYSRATRFHLLDGLEIRQYRSNGTFDVMLSPVLDVKGENRYDPAAYYTEGEAVIIETAEQLNAREYGQPLEINGYYFPTMATKIIVVDSEGKVRGIALVQNQRHEGVNRCDRDTRGEGSFWPAEDQGGGISFTMDDGSVGEVYSTSCIIWAGHDQANNKHAMNFYIPTYLMVQPM